MSKSWLLGSGAALLVAALALNHLFPDAVPKFNETPKQYMSRLPVVLSKAGAELESIYLRTLYTGKSVGSTPADGSPRSAPSPPKQQDTLKQPVAQNEAEINAQQEVSVKRYKQAREEAGSSPEEVILPEQPDEVRERMPKIDPKGPEMKCGKAIPTTSSITTRNVELRAKSIFQGSGGNQFGWKYVITFINRGTETVQMLTRHWVFVDANGNLEAEVKGPGARGVTPVLPPGGEWNYESGTGLPTPYGSMHGSFQFEVLKGDTSHGRRSFSARVGRLLLAKKADDSRVVPCLDLADVGIPSTSVMVTERVIVGARVDFAKKGKKQKTYHYVYDVQINNALDSELQVVGHAWEVVDSNGHRKVLSEGSGVGGVFKSRNHKLAAGDAFRVQGELTAPTPKANAQGVYQVIIKGENGLPVQIEARTDWVGLSADKKEPRVPNFVAD